VRGLSRGAATLVSFLRLVVLKLEARTGQTDRQTDRQMNGQDP